ncbi:MAG: DUF348 domain-containing protein [Anaerolineales bacterium]|nr:DUF348 domain-containing protein [Anaerolineales bacterium]
MARWGLLLSLLALLIGCTPSPDECCTVTLIADGATRSVFTGALTVRDVLAEAGVTLDADDRVSPVEPTLVEDGMAIRVVRVDVRLETERREVPFERRTVRDATVPEGQTRLLEPGVVGVEELTYRITVEDGMQVERHLVDTVLVTAPRTEVVLIGAQADVSAVPISGTLAYLASRNAWVIQRTSRNQRRLTYTGDLDGRVFALSPEGTALLFTRAVTATGAEGARPADEDGGEPDEGLPDINSLWLLDLATVDAQPIDLGVPNVLWADWAPDCRGELTGRGCRIAYTTAAPTESDAGWKAENDLWVGWPRATDGALLGLRRVVEPNAGGAYGWWGATFAWAPNGEALAYARADEVGVVKVVNGAATPLARFAPFRTYAAWVWAPSVSWSRDGALIVTTLHGESPSGDAPEDSPVFDVWALAADGTITAELSSEAGMWAAPSCAPRGDWIVFGRARSPYASQTSGYDLYLMDRDGSDQQLLFPAAEELGLTYPEVAWGPQGDRLVVVYQGNLVLLSLADGGAMALTNQGDAAAVRWRW